MQTKNKIVPQIPILDNEHIIYDMPLSVVIIGKLGFGLGSLLFFVPAFNDNHMDLWARVAVCVAGAASLFCAIHPKAWYLRFFSWQTSEVCFFPVVMTLLIQRNKNSMTGYSYLGKISSICELLKLTILMA